MDVSKQINLSINSSEKEIIASLIEFNKLFLKFYQGKYLSHCHKIRIALYELLANALEHGNQSNYLKKINLFIILEENQIKISVEDEGDGFNYKKLFSSSVFKGILLSGLKLIQFLVDDLSFNSKGNKIFFQKKIS